MRNRERVCTWLAAGLFLLALAAQAHAQTALVVDFDDTDYRLVEGNSLTVTVTLTPVADREVVIPIEVTPYPNAAWAAETTDYTVSGLTGGNLAFAIGDASKTFVVTANHDDGLALEDVELDFGTLPDAVTSSRADETYRAVVRILDDDFSKTDTAREDQPSDRYFTFIAVPKDPEGDELIWWIEGPESQFFSVFTFTDHATHDFGLFVVRPGVVLDRAVKDRYEFLFNYSDGNEQSGPDPGCSASTPSACRADYFGTIVVNITDAPEIALDPSSVVEGTADNSIGVSFLGFQAADMVSFSVGGPCGSDGILDLGTPPTVAIADDGTATATLSVTAGGVTRDTDCAVVATGTKEIWERVDTVEATVTVENLPEPPRPEEPEPEEPDPDEPRAASRPGAPRQLAARPGNGQVTLTWEAPSSNGGSAIVRYEYRVDGRDEWTGVGNVLRTTAGSLTNGRSHTFEVRAVNGVGAGPAARARATPVQPNRPPAFRSTRYVFELKENLDGRSSPVTLGTVEARDPDGDEVRYELTAGARARFAVDPRSGLFVYTGPGEDFETGPQRYELRVRADDDEGAAADAEVEVRVIDVNEAPEPVDDEAETLEDAPVTIAVLANDRDGDGDPLSVLAVSAPTHGAAAVSPGGEVVYTPEPDYHGRDAFAYTVGDGRGLTASAAVDVTVLPVNDPPEAVGVIPDQDLEVGDPPVTIDLTPYFRDRDGDPLTYTVTASDPVVEVTVAGATLTLNGVNRGTASVTATARDPGGLTAAQTFAAMVSDRRVRGVLEDTLAAIGRGRLASARSTLGRRVESAGGEQAQVTVAGYRVPLGAGAAATAGRAAAERWLLSMAAGPMAAAGPLGMGLGPRTTSGWLDSGSAGLSPHAGLGTSPAGLAIGSPFGNAGGLPIDARGGRHGLRGSRSGFGSPLISTFGGGRTEFLLPLGGAQEDEEEAGEGVARGRRWTVWGQGDVQTFEGARSAAESYAGDVRTAYMGVDTRLSDRWLAGLAVARSSAGGDWRYGLADGRLTTMLTSVEPYLRWSDGDTSVWTTVGGGRGAARNERRLHGHHEESTFGLRLGLVEVRRRVATVAGGLEVHLRGDASWARLTTGAGDELIDGLQVAVHQARVGAEAGRRVRTAGGTLVEPFGEVHARRDGGSGQAGAGLELAGGIRVARGVVRIEGVGRMLALHSAADYSERGAALTVSMGEGARRPGLTLSLSPRWGAQATGSDALWQEEVYRSRYGAGRDEGALDLRVGYGVRLPAAGLLTPFGVYGRSSYGQRLRAGAVVEAAGDDPDPPLGLEVSAERYSRPGHAGTDRRLSVLGRITFGGPERGAGPGSARTAARRGGGNRRQPIGPVRAPGSPATGVAPAPHARAGLGGAR
ncbi:MAG: tandem-95 repeat protein [Acidobacteria bacterium]|nr:tandem-95 repeat protein [Acidobacteriota bacterium]